MFQFAWSDHGLVVDLMVQTHGWPLSPFYKGSAMQTTWCMVNIFLEGWEPTLSWIRYIIINHLCQEIYLISVVWIWQTFENKFGMKHKFAKYLNESCRKNCDEYLSFKHFLHIAFVREISPKLSSSFRRYRHDWLKYNIGNHHSVWLCFDHWVTFFRPVQRLCQIPLSSINMRLVEVSNLKKM